MEILFAAAGTGQQGGGIAAFLPFIVIMVIIYFLMIRPQSKRQKTKQKMIESLKKGDKVVTMGGIHGTIAGIKDKGKVIVLKVDKNTNVHLNRSAVAGLAGSVSEEETASIES